MNEIQELWRSYNLIAKLLKDKLNRTSNIVGEYAEYLIAEYTSGELLTASYKSADVRSHNGDLYQVKSRKISTQLGTLGIIRTWGFDFLAVVLFDEYGNIKKAFLSPKEIAKEYGKRNDLQNGWIITLTKKFINHDKNKDITTALKSINIEKVGDLSMTNNSQEKTNGQEKNDLPIGAYVRTTFKDLVDNSQIDEIELEKLQQSEYSKVNLGIQYPFLRKVLISDTGKIPRYWKNPISIYGNKYFICSEWYESKNNNDRPYYNKWLKKMKK